MQIICRQTDLMNSINIVSKAVPVKSTMPILTCISITATPVGIRLTATDTELGIETMLIGSVTEPGTIALDAKIFQDIVRKLPDGDVTLTTDSNYQAVITCEKSKFDIAGRPTDEFPALPEVVKDSEIRISQFTMREMIRQTIFSIAASDNNKLMTGEFLEVTGNRMRLISLDGHRISIRKILLDEDYGNFSAVIPGKTLSELSKILSAELKDEMHISFSKKYVSFEFDGTLMTSRLIEGEYYKVDQMLSNDYETKLVVNRRQLMDSIDRAQLLIRENEKKPVILNITDDSMNIRAMTSLGSLNEDIEVEKSGVDILIGFNPRLLMDAIRVIDNEELNIYLFNPKAPCFIRDDEDSYLYLILPVNFNASDY